MRTDSGSDPAPAEEHLTPEQEERLDRVVSDYLDSRKAGHPIERAALIAANPDLARALEEFFRDQAAVERVVAPFRISAGPEEPLAPPPARIGAYEILGEIARGGMGVVYKARQPGLERVVALKTVAGGALASRDLVGRFLREARAGASLDHPHIVPIYEVDSADGQHYYVMKYMEGGSLAAGAPALRGEFTAIARLVETIARAVQFAHEHGILHRDLKPANVLLDSGGLPHVSDFGLAAFLEGENTLTRSGDALGSPSYMSPEQAEGRRRDISTRADVYSLGAILYELLTSAPPFGGRTAIETLRKVVEEPPAPPRRMEPSVPRDLETICLKCLEKSPTRRYASAGELAQDLARFLRGETIIARTPGAGEKMVRWARRNRVAVRIMAVLLVAAVVSGAFGWLWRGELRNALSSQRERLLSQARLRRLSHTPGARFQGLRDLAEAVQIRPGSDLRDEAIACLAVADCEEEPARPAWPLDSPAFTFDVDYLRYAICDANGMIHVRAVEGDRRIASFQAKTQKNPLLLFSPDGRRLLERADRGVPTGKVFLWDLERPGVSIEAPESPSHTAYDFHPDSRSLFLGTPRGEVLRVETATGAVLDRLKGVGLPSRIRVDGSGSRFAICEAGGRRFQVVETANGTVHGPWSSASGLVNIMNLSWHRNGDLLALCGAGSRSVEIWDVSRGELVRNLEGAENGVPTAELSPDGGSLAAVDWSGVLRLWDTVTWRERLSTSISHTELGFSRSGDRLGVSFARPAVSTWRFDPGRETRRIPDSADFGESIAFHPGRRVLGAAGRSGVLLWDLALERRIGVVPSGATFSLWFSPDGSLLGTSGYAGIFAWRLHWSSTAEGDLLTVEKSEGRSSGSNGVISRGALSADWSTDRGHLAMNVARGNDNRVAFVDLADPEKKPRFVEHRRGTFLAMSPDGRWVASGPHVGEAVRVWSFDTGNEVARYECGAAEVRFSPDSRRLITSGDRGLGIYETGSWREVHHEVFRALEVRSCDVSPDAAVLAINEPATQIRLSLLESGRVLATLTPPDLSNISAMAFSPDGALLAVATSSFGVQVWDLRLLRAGLSRLGLDWDQPPLSPAANAGVPLPIRFELWNP